MDLSSLNDAIAGEVLLPGDRDYAAAATVAKGPGHPVAVVRPADAGDVATAVGFARDNRLVLSVRGGGHDSRGMSTNEGGIVVDLRTLAGIHVDDDLVTIGGGAVWGDVADALAPHGLALSSGDTRSVGVGGLSLGGGVGWFVRLWGLAIDSLVAADVVLADGRIVTASETSEPELFWALRGGGGNFGVVTAFTFRAHPLPDGVVSGSIDFDPDADLAEIFRVWRDTLRSAPEQLSTTYLGFPAFGEGMPASSRIEYVWAGDDVEAARAAVAPIADLPSVIGATSAAKPYAEVLVGEHPDADAAGAPVMRLVDENGFAARFDDALIDELAAVKVELGATVLMVRLLGGAFSRVAPEATAWGYRDTEAWLFSVGFVPEEAYEMEARRQRAAWSRLDPWLRGMYGNFSSLDDAVERMYPPATLDRLRRIKAVYDPSNLFQRTHNIRPA